jgi:OFA family oxalate/formate antiporter-like MFS transporter
MGSEGQKGQGRGLIVTAAVLVMATTGTLYAWAIFTQPALSAFRWDVGTTLANFCITVLGVLIGGYWQDRAGPQRSATTGITLWGVGHMLAGWGMALWGTPWLLTSGLAGGVRAGMPYVTPVALITKWFPAHKSIVGGLLAGGFGFGAVVFNRGLSLPSVVTMRILVGAGFFAVALGAAWLFRHPAAVAANPAPTCAPDISRAATGLSPAQMIRTRQFYLVWLQMFINAMAGIVVISNALPILQDLTHEPISALACSFGWVSLFYAVGRYFWTSVCTRLGCAHTVALMLSIQAVTLCWLSGVHQLNCALFGFAVILLCYGGGFGVMPAYTAKCFGRKFMGVNYALVLTAWGLAGVIAPLLISFAKSFNSTCAGALSLISAVLLASVILPYLTSKPTRNEPASDLATRWACETR